MGIRGTDFEVNTVGKGGSGGVVTHVIEGSINQSNESGTSVVEAGSYSSISNQQSSPVVTSTSPVTFDNNIAPAPSSVQVDTNSLFGANAGPVESGTHVSVVQGEVAVAGSSGKPVTVSKSMASSVGKTGAASAPTTASSFQVMDSTYATPTTVAAVPVPTSTKNTIIIGGTAGGVSANAAAGSTSVTTIVIQEQTIATPYNYR